MGTSIFQLRSFALLSFVGLAGTPPLVAGGSGTGADIPALAPVGQETGSPGSNSDGPGTQAEAQPSKNWYQFFRGPGWDPAVIVHCGIYGSGAPYHGCANSADPEGGRLIVDSGDAGMDDVVLYAYGERPGALSVFVQTRSKGATGLPFGDGVRCVSGLLRRLYSRIATGGMVSAPSIGEASIRRRSAELGDPIPSPASRYYQIWYRDGSERFNISSALQIDWP